MIIREKLIGRYRLRVIKTCSHIKILLVLKKKIKPKKRILLVKQFGFSPLEGAIASCSADKSGSLVL